MELTYETYVCGSIKMASDIPSHSTPTLQSHDYHPERDLGMLEFSCYQCLKSNLVYINNIAICFPPPVKSLQ